MGDLFSDQSLYCRDSGSAKANMKRIHKMVERARVAGNEAHDLGCQIGKFRDSLKEAAADLKGLDELAEQYCERMEIPLSDIEADIASLKSNLIKVKRLLRGL